MCLFFYFSQIPTNDAGLIEYRCHPFWNQKYCPSHEYDKTARCCSCERLEVNVVKYEKNISTLIIGKPISFFFFHKSLFFFLCCDQVMGCEILHVRRWEKSMSRMYGNRDNRHWRLPTALPCDKRLLRRNVHETWSTNSHASCSKRSSQWCYRRREKCNPWSLDLYITFFSLSFSERVRFIIPFFTHRDTITCLRHGVYVCLKNKQSQV